MSFNSFFNKTWTFFTSNSILKLVWIYYNICMYEIHKRLPLDFKVQKTYVDL